ncbi:MAG: hypothetical protein ABUK17_04645, partial [Syntrophobacteria bacterium]
PNEREKDHPGQEVIWQHLSILPFQFDTATHRFSSGQLADLQINSFLLSTARSIFPVSASVNFYPHHLIKR